MVGWHCRWRETNAHRQVPVSCSFQGSQLRLSDAIFSTLGIKERLLATRTDRTETLFKDLQLETKKKRDLVLKFELK